MSQTPNQPQNEEKPPFTNLELLVADLLVNGPRPTVEAEANKFSQMIVEFLMCDGPERLEPRMAAIAKCNGDAIEPINVSVMKLPEGTEQQFLNSFKTALKTRKNSKNQARLKRG